MILGILLEKSASVLSLGQQFKNTEGLSHFGRIEEVDVRWALGLRLVAGQRLHLRAPQGQKLELGSVVGGKVAADSAGEMAILPVNGNDKSCFSLRLAQLLHNHPRLGGQEVAAAHTGQVGQRGDAHQQEAQLQPRRLRLDVGEVAARQFGAAKGSELLFLHRFWGCSVHRFWGCSFHISASVSPHKVTKDQRHNQMFSSVFFGFVWFSVRPRSGIT